MAIAYFIQTANSKLVTLIFFISVGFMTILYTYGIFNLRMLATKLPDANNNQADERQGSNAVVPSEVNIR